MAERLGHEKIETTLATYSHLYPNQVRKLADQLMILWRRRMKNRRENIQCIIDAIQEMQVVMREIAGQIQPGNFSLSDDGYQELKADYLSLDITVVDILDGAAYLFEREPTSKHRNWKAELELEQYRHVLEVEQQKENMERAEESDEEKCPKYGCNRGKK